MRVTSKDKLDDFQIIGQKLRIHWDHEEVTVEGADGETETQWQCEEAITKKNASKADVVKAIISSKYDIYEELAAINNGYEWYDAYQNFRQKAKDIADNYLVFING